MTADPTAPPRIAWHTVDAWRAAGEPPLAPLLADHLAAGVRALVPLADCHAAAAEVLRRRSAWTADFGGEQFAFGRAFYTHLETGRAADYFKNSRRSDEQVEAALPGMQARVRACFATFVGGRARPRQGFCGPGVHVFPAGEKVAREGGVVHFDTEGLSPLHRERRARAMTLIVALQPPTGDDGGLRIWDVRYHGRDTATPAELRRPTTTLVYEPGDALLLDSYRLHQIQPFPGARDRITVTLHGVEVDTNVWETWF